MNLRKKKEYLNERYTRNIFGSENNDLIKSSSVIIILNETE
jgi:hypothetical protein